ncbi:MAG TPA: hypothetical protein VH913_20470 [Hyphomicrobiaceae bacterium]
MSIPRGLALPVAAAVDHRGTGEGSDPGSPEWPASLRRAVRAALALAAGAFLLLGLVRVPGGRATGASAAPPAPAAVAQS